MVKQLMEWSKDNKDEELKTPELVESIFTNAHWQNLSTMNKEIIDIFKGIR